MELRQWQRGFCLPSQKRTDRTHQHEWMGPQKYGHDPVGRPPTAITSEDRLGPERGALLLTQLPVCTALVVGLPDGLGCVDLGVIGRSIVDGQCGVPIDARVGVQ